MATRREFLTATLGGLAAGTVCFGAEAPARQAADLRGLLGITTGTFVRHLSTKPTAGKLRLVDLPKIMRDELDLRVIDLMTATLASNEPQYLDELRGAADKAGCVLTNLKMNLNSADIYHADPDVRRPALDAYRRAVDVAARLGVRWVRPQPGGMRPDMAILAASFKELMEYAAPHKIGLLVENNGWMRGDPSAIPAIIQAVGPALAASPDTGNWTDAARYEGLAKSFPLAVTCDFKALTFGPDGQHEAYDLKRCFQIGWDAGFRGPWCFEHFHSDLKMLLKEMGMLRDMLRGWIREQATQ